MKVMDLKDNFFFLDGTEYPSCRRKRGAARTCYSQALCSVGVQVRSYAGPQCEIYGVEQAK
jgi:hypothetical protein